MKNDIPVALVYDFDGTLAPGNMQERDFIPALGMTSRDFWDEVKQEARRHDGDDILMYMKLMLEKAEASRVPVRRESFEAFGAKLSFFKGVTPYTADGNPVPGWFERINAYGSASGVAVKHYIVSSGIREMVTGSPVAGWFESIFASSFCYDHNGVARWPALAVNYTNKTQFLFRINKGELKVFEHKKINQFIPKKDRSVPFEQMVFIGDGETDIPCFRLTKDQGGYAIAVYRPSTRGAKSRADTLRDEGRVHFISAADYREGTHLDKLIKGIIDKISFDHHLKDLGMKR